MPASLSHNFPASLLPCLTISPLPCITVSQPPNFPTSYSRIFFCLSHSHFRPQIPLPYALCSIRPPSAFRIPNSRRGVGPAPLGRRPNSIASQLHHLSAPPVKFLTKNDRHANSMTIHRSNTENRKELSRIRARIVKPRPEYPLTRARWHKYCCTNQLF